LLPPWPANTGQKHLKNHRLGDGPFSQGDDISLPLTHGESPLFSGGAFFRHDLDVDLDIRPPLVRRLHRRGGDDLAKDLGGVGEAFQIDGRGGQDELFGFGGIGRQQRFD